jgi:hypothetical protein
MPRSDDNKIRKQTRIRGHNGFAGQLNDLQMGLPLMQLHV